MSNECKPVPDAWQFLSDGKWHNGDDRIKDHRKNTEEAGYPTRDLYAAAPQPPALGGEPIKRYCFEGSHQTCDCGNPDRAVSVERSDGEYVKYNDHQAHLARLQAEIGRLRERVTPTHKSLISKHAEIIRERDQLKTDLAERWEQIAELNSEIVKLKRRGDDAISNLKMARFALIDIKNGNASSLTTIREMAAEALKATESVSQYGEGVET